MSIYDRAPPQGAPPSDADDPFNERSDGIVLPCGHPAYELLLQLFAPALEAQAGGTTDEIRLGTYDVLVPVPYRAWRRQLSDVSELLDRCGNTTELNGTWPALKKRLEGCCCLITPTDLLIAPCTHFVDGGESLLLKELVGRRAATVRQQTPQDREAWPPLRLPATSIAPDYFALSPCEGLHGSQGLFSARGMIVTAVVLPLPG